MQATAVRGNRVTAANKPNHLLRLNRLLILLLGLMVFLPQFNPGRISMKINENASLFTTAISYDTLTNSLGRPLRMEWVLPQHFHMLMAGAAVILVGVVLCAIGGCMSLGNNRMKRVAMVMPTAGSVLMGAGLVVINHVYNIFINLERADKIEPFFPDGIYMYAVVAVLVFITSLIVWLRLPKQVEEKMEMEEKYRLFLMMLPVLLLAFVFCYLPIYGWRFAFFDYKIGDALTAEKFVGLKWFTYLFENAATRNDLVRVLRNTLIMSGLGIITSWFPIAFAVLLAEVRSTKFQRVVQTLTTIPNFISWVLVYAIAFAIFSTDGFINSFLRNVMHATGANVDYLANPDGTWIKMLLWGTWKGLGWSAIVYIAGIAGIDQQLYEAAKVDGANRYQCIWHITIPGLVPTYCVMLLMSIAGILSNGMDQYLVFENALNKDVIEVLDLYVYNIGIKQGLIPISTVVGVFKSLIGVTLLFGANGISKAIRGESII